MKKNNDTIFNLIVFCIWGIFVLILIQFHENWRDEAQAWFIVKDLSVVDIFRQLKYEGHPFLWYAVLFPFAKLGFNYCIINYISAFFVGIAVYLILFKTNFSKFIKLIICFSPGFLYFFPVISRSYCLLPALIVGILLLHNKKEYIILYNFLILLLLNTHLLVAPFCLTLMFLEFIDLIKNFEKKKIFGLLISCFGIFILVFQLFGCKGINDETVQHFLVIPFCKNVFKYLFSVVLIPYCIILFCKLNKNEKKLTWLLFVLIVGFDFVIYYTGFSSEQKQLIVSLFFIFTLYFIKSKILLTYLIIIFLTLFSPYYENIIDDLNINYSSAKELSMYIKSNINKNENIIVFDDFAISSIAGYAEEYKYINILESSKNRFVTWSKERNIQKKRFQDLKDKCIYIEKKLEEFSSNYIIITDNNFDLFNCKKWKLLFSTQKAIFNGEQYKLYFVSK